MMTDVRIESFLAGHSIPQAGPYGLISRTRKALRVLAVLEDALGDLSGLNLLDIGCSRGIMTWAYARKVGQAAGVDVEPELIEFAREHNASPNLKYLLAQGDTYDLPSESFDIITCTQVYEHANDAEVMMSEIYRLLKPGGVCCFSAANRLKWADPHYGGKLPLLTVIPKPLGHLYLRVLGRSRYYHETHRTLWGLKKLTRRFEMVDYTRRAAGQPEKFFTEDSIPPGSTKQRLALALIDYAYWLCPSYLWILKKAG